MVNMAQAEYTVYCKSETDCISTAFNIRHIYRGILTSVRACDNSATTVIYSLSRDKVTGFIVRAEGLAAGRSLTLGLVALADEQKKIKITLTPVNFGILEHFSSSQ